MEKYSSVACLRISMWLIPFVCVFGVVECEYTGTSTLTSVELLAERNDTIRKRFVEDPSFGLSDVYSSEKGEGAVEPILSKPIIEDLPENSLIYSNRRRDVPDRGFPDATKLEILDLHNMYRGNVTPPAGNMALLEWDTQLEHLAQLWADKCVFEHGKPPNTSYPGLYSQNLYIGTDPTGHRGLWLWYDEYNYYNLTSQICDPNQQCGHYITMAWAESLKLGCGIRKCESRYLIVCHYFPAALKGQQMYTVAKPCSQCPDEKGSLCLNNLCMSWEQCKRNPKLCETAKCNLKCHNCGHLNKTNCKCECADGWDSPDCSTLCSDEHARCGVSPGFPNKAACSMNRHAVAKKYCRKMCQTCNSYEEDSKINHICCGGKFCDPGYVLDFDRKLCRCTILCPGPLCDILEGSGASLRNNLIILVLTISVAYFITHNSYFTRNK